MVLSLTPTLLLTTPACGQNPSATKRGGNAEATARIVVSSVKPPEASRPIGAFVSRYGLLRRDFESIAAFVDGVRRAVPVRQFDRNARYAAFTANIHLVGTTNGFAEVSRRRVLRGRFLSKRDEKTRNNVVVLGSEAAARLFLDIEPVGKSISIGSDSYLVIGRLASVPIETVGAGKRKRKVDHNLDVYMPLSTMRVRYDNRGLNIKRTPGSFNAEQVDLHEIHISVKDVRRLDKSAAEIRTLLKRTHKNEDYSIKTRQ